MFKDAFEVLEFIESGNVKMVDLKVIDLPGRWHHVTVPAGHLTPDSLHNGVGVDTSSYPGYKKVEAGDARVMPDLSTGMVDPVCAIKTLSFICDIVEPISGEPYGRDPRGIARRAAEHFSTVVNPGEPVFSPEMEFYLFSEVQYISETSGAGYKVDSTEADWNSAAGGMPHLGYKIPPHGGYHATPPRDQLNDLRSEVLMAIEEAGVVGHYHHHEVGAPGQSEIEVGHAPA